MSRWKRVLVVLASVAAALVALYAMAVGYLVFRPGAEDYAHRTAFDSKLWRDRSMDGDIMWPTRLRMIDDLIVSGRLRGLERSQIEPLLGPGDATDKWRDWDLVYWLGPERGWIRIDSEWLVIRFDSAGRLSDYQLVRD